MTRRWNHVNALLLIAGVSCFIGAQMCDPIVGLVRAMALAFIAGGLFVKW